MARAPSHHASNSARSTSPEPSRSIACPAAQPPPYAQPRLPSKTVPRQTRPDQTRPCHAMPCHAKQSAPSSSSRSQPHSGVSPASRPASRRPFPPLPCRVSRHRRDRGCRRPLASRRNRVCTVSTHNSRVLKNVPWLTVVGTDFTAEVGGSVHETIFAECTDICPRRWLRLFMGPDYRIGPRIQCSAV